MSNFFCDVQNEVRDLEYCLTECKYYFKNECATVCAYNTCKKTICAGIRSYINTPNRNKCDYFIIDQIENYINELEKGLK